MHDPHEYELLMRNDLHSRGHTQWFYFSVSKMDRAPYQFTITNFAKRASMYNHGMKICLYSTKLAEIGAMPALCTLTIVWCRHWLDQSGPRHSVSSVATKTIQRSVYCGALMIRFDLRIREALVLVVIQHKLPCRGGPLLSSIQRTIYTQ